MVRNKFADPGAALESAKLAEARTYQLFRRTSELGYSVERTPYDSFGK
jgi:hypothetical protein